MSVPPRTEHDESGWEVSGEQPATSSRHPKSDRLGIGLVAMVLLAVVIAAILLIVI